MAAPENRISPGNVLHFRVIYVIILLYIFIVFVCFTSKKRRKEEAMVYHILSYAEEAVRKYPDRIALADANTKLTYREMWAFVTSLGSRIAAKVGKTRAPLAVCIRHDVTDVLLFLSIAYSGNFYVPVDLSLPEERVLHMLSDLQPLLIFTRDGMKISERMADFPLCTLDSLPTPETEVTAPWKKCKDTDPLYVIFTSGSTGVPKGVVVSHRSVIDMAEQFCAVFDFAENTVFGNQAPFDFDVSVKDIYLSLKVGGRLEILEKKLFSFPKLLIERLNGREIDTVIWAVPALKIMSELDAFREERPRFLKNVMFSGEVLPPKSLAYWREKVPHARYVNLYGPTEITCNCTYHIVDEIQGDGSIPIGIPFPNCDVFLLEGDVPVQDGEIGEICVSGSCLALGYYNRPEQTAAAFTQNPLQTAYGERIYRAGDLGKIENGLLYYMGRRDTQIKHMGHRIELGEIELCANAMAGVAVSACVYDGEKAKITLFFRGDAEPADVSKHLRGRLPKYMLPAAVRRVDQFPRTRTGKIDRKTLLQMAAE